MWVAGNQTQLRRIFFRCAKIGDVSRKISYTPRLDRLGCVQPSNFGASILIITVARLRSPKIGVPQIFPNHPKLDNFSTETHGFRVPPF